MAAARRGRSGPPAEMAEALVLASYESRDDRIVVLFGATFGRLSAVARHARKSSRRFGGHIDPLTRTEVALRVRPDWELARLDRASSLEVFPIVKGDLLRMALATTMAEVVLQIVPEHQHEPDLYALTLKAWRHLNDPARPASEALLALFELRALQLSGFLPELSDLPGLPTEAIPVLESWLAGRWQPLSDKLVARTCELLEQLLAENAQRPLKSRGFLDEALQTRR